MTGKSEFRCASNHTFPFLDLYKDMFFQEVQSTSKKACVTMATACTIYIKPYKNIQPRHYVLINYHCGVKHA